MYCYSYISASLLYSKWHNHFDLTFLGEVTKLCVRGLPHRVREKFFTSHLAELLIGSVDIYE